MTVIIPIEETHVHKARFTDGILLLVSARYGASMRIAGPGFDVEARVGEEVIRFPEPTGLLTCTAWVGTVMVRGHSHRVVALGMWEDRDRVAHAVADELLSVLKMELAPPLIQRASEPIAAPPPAWLVDVAALSNEVVEGLKAGSGDSEDRALDDLYDRIDDALCAGDFASVDRELAAVDVEKTDVTMLLGWLTITYAAKDKLPSFTGMARRVFERLEHERGTEETLALTRGLVDGGGTR